jgi:predicted porin
MFGATLLCAAGAASAQTSVTLYGVVDAFGQYVTSGSGTKAGPGTPYAPGTHVLSEQSGGSTGSLFGLKGTEDLGGGLRAAFDVENGFKVKDGSFFGDGSLFYRQAWVGLQHATYGSLTFGRQYQPTFNVLYPADPFRANDIASLVAAAILDLADPRTMSTQYTSGRSSNSIIYTSPNLYGLKFSGMYAFTAPYAVPPTFAGTLGNTLDLSITYTGGSLYASFGYMYQHSGNQTVTQGGVGLPVPLAGTAHYSGALAYRIGIVNLQAFYMYTQPKDVSLNALQTAALRGNSAHSVSIASIGATIQATSQDVIELQGIQRSVRGAHDNALGVQVGVDHSLSKRTSVYVASGLPPRAR